MLWTGQNARAPKLKVTVFVCIHSFPNMLPSIRILTWFKALFPEAFGCRSDYSCFHASANALTPTVVGALWTRHCLDMCTPGSYIRYFGVQWVRVGPNRVPGVWHG